MRLLDITLEAKDLTAAYGFYAGDLGLPVLRRSPNELSLQAGASRLNFRPAEHSGMAPFYHFAFNVHPARFERARAAMAALTPLVHDNDGREVFDFRSWDATACYFIDPLGNIGELIARRDLRSEVLPPDPGILSIGEIGLVTGNVPALATRLSHQLGIDTYRDSSGDEFAALGDERGLLILVRQGRAWYPDTAKPAVAANLTLQVEVPGRARYRLQGPLFNPEPVSG